MTSLFIVLAAGFLVGPPQEKQKEFYENGKLKAEFTLDKEGRRHGRYTEYFESGRKKITAEYVHGDLHGDWAENHENGKPFGRKSFVKGLASGDITRADSRGTFVYRASWVRGQPFIHFDLRSPEPAYRRSIEDIRKRINEIDPPENRRGLTYLERFEEASSADIPHKAGKLRPEYLQEGLNQLNVYRYLSELSPGVTLDPEYTEHAQFAAVIMAANKELSHQPPKPPGMADAFYAKGQKGAGSCNLHRGQPDLRRAVDSFMYDSDDTNIAKVAHRAWILNPELGKTGFGECDGYVSLWTADKGAKPERPDLIAYPARGFAPIEYIRPGAAWSVSPKDGKFKLPSEKDFQVRAWLLDEGLDFIKELEVNHKSIRADGGFGPAAVFRPALTDGLTWEGKRVWAIICRGETPLFGLFVHFFTLTPPSPPGKD